MFLFLSIDNEKDDVIVWDFFLKKPYSRIPKTLLFNKDKYKKRGRLI